MAADNRARRCPQHQPDHLVRVAFSLVRTSPAALSIRQFRIRAASTRGSRTSRSRRRTLHDRRSFEVLISGNVGGIQTIIRFD